MIWGTGVPVVKQMTQDGIRSGAVTMPRPMSREFQDFEEIFLDFGPDQNNKPVKKFMGYQFRAVLIWSSVALSASEINNLMTIGNWRASGARADLQPHNDKSNAYTCEVTKFEINPMDGKVFSDRILIEFTGVNLMPKKPNSADYNHTKVRRLHFVSTGWSSI